MARSFFAVLLLPLMLSACGTKEINSMIETRLDDIQGKIQVAKEPGASSRSTDALVVSDNIWAGDQAFRMTSGEPLPAEWLRSDAIAIRSDTPMQLTQLASILSSQTKIPIRLTGGAETIDADLRQSQTGTAAAPGSAASAASGQTETGLILSYEGPLPGLLDLIAGYYNVNWQYSAGTITINRYLTRTFVLDALPGSIAVSAPGATGASSGAAASATVTPLASANIDIWADVRSTLDSLIETQGSVTISQSSGTIVVSTTADRMEQVSRYLEDENARLSRQVAITIELYSVDVADSAQYGLDLSAVISSIEGLPTINLSGPSGALSGSGGASTTITLVEPNELTGTRGIARALSSLGKTTQLAQIPITTLNNRPANQRIARDRAYVSEITSTTTGTVGATTSSATTDTITTGITVSVLPRIMSDGRILLQYALAQGELIGEPQTFDVGTTGTIQLPVTQGLSFSQQVMMKNGSTLVLAGYDQSDASSTGRGVGRPLSWVLGGTSATSQARRMVVIAITPREISVARREAS